MFFFTWHLRTAVECSRMYIHFGKVAVYDVIAGETCTCFESCRKYLISTSRGYNSNNRD